MSTSEFEYRRFCNMHGDLNARTVGDAIIALEKAVAAIQDELKWLRESGAIPHRHGTCEHNIVDGDWCEACNRAMKVAASEND